MISVKTDVGIQTETAAQALYTEGVRINSLYFFVLNLPSHQCWLLYPLLQFSYTGQYIIGRNQTSVTLC